MSNRFIVLICLVFMLTPLRGDTQSSSSSGRMQASVGHFFAAAGLLYGPGSFRVGKKDWEAGLLNTRSIGINKLFASQDIYFGMGLVLSGAGYRPGVYGSFGVEFLDFGWINLRAEINGTQNIQNNGYGELLLGISLNL